MECPFCEHTGLDAEVNSCPSCKADLSAYHALDSISASIKKQKTVSLIFIILFILLLLAVVVIYLLMDQDAVSKDKTSESTNNELVIQKLQKEKQALQSMVSDLQQENSSLKESAEEMRANKPVTHVIKQGESLYSIAETYLGNGKLYPKIAADNGIEDPDIIIVGAELVINK
jgi:nucleoid-associated protein YgaU